MKASKVIVPLLYVVLIITIDIIHALQFLPFLTNRLGSSKRLDHKLIKEVRYKFYLRDKESISRAFH